MPGSAEFGLASYIELEPPEIGQALEHEHECSNGGWGTWVRPWSVFLFRLEAAALVPQEAGAIVRRTSRGTGVAQVSQRVLKAMQSAPMPFPTGWEDSETLYSQSLRPRSQRAHYGIGNGRAVFLCLAASHSGAPSLPVSYPICARVFPLILVF